MKRLAIFVLSGAFALMLTACGDETTTIKTEKTPASSSTTTTTTPAPATEQPKTE